MSNSGQTPIEISSTITNDDQSAYIEHVTKEVVTLLHRELLNKKAEVLRWLQYYAEMDVYMIVEECLADILRENMRLHREALEHGNYIEDLRNQIHDLETSLKHATERLAVHGYE